jgi:hypothetical protein
MERRHSAIETNKVYISKVNIAFSGSICYMYVCEYSPFLEDRDQDDWVREA